MAPVTCHLLFLVLLFLLNPNNGQAPLDDSLTSEDNPFEEIIGTECYTQQCMDKVVTDALLKCSGFASCKHSQLTSFGDIICSGFQSCKGAQLLTTDNEHQLECSGGKSCVESNIYSHNTIALGRYSLQSAIIDSIGKTQIYIKSGGYYGGQNAHLFCREGSTCELECSKDGCYQFQLFCEPGSVCIVPDDCVNNYDEDITFIDTDNDDSISYCPVFIKDEDDILPDILERLKLNKNNKNNKQLFTKDNYNTSSNKYTKYYAIITIFVLLFSLTIYIFCRSYWMTKKKKINIDKNSDELTTLLI